MRRRVGLSAFRSPNNRLISTLFSLSLSAALVLIPVLPIRAADARRAPTSAPEAPPPARASAAATAPAALAAPSLTATKTDAFPDPDGDGKAEPGQTITYTVTVTNNGPDDATGVVFNDTVDANTTLVPGSVRTQPVAAGDSYNVLGNVRIQPGAAAGLLANDCDADNGGACGGAGLTASGPTTSAQGGNVAVNPDGSFQYNPPAGFEGADSFTYTVTDATGLSDTATASLTVNDVVWFVDNSAAPGGDGRLTSPFNALAPLNGPGGAGDPDEGFDVIFVHEGAGAYAGGIALEDNQRLVGQGTSLDTALSAFAVAVPPHSDARPAMTGNPTVANAAGDAVAL
ncbi:MAG TPA: Ig-like domain-containing protein, partial [Pyrinomonadaceae bacterium]